MVQAAQVTPIRVVRVRTETPQRWQKALKRAIAQGLEVFTVADTGERFVTSASKLDTLHRSDGESCTCEAALSGDPVCQHRAVVRFVLGWLRPDPEPETPAPALTLVPARLCFWCNGTGLIPNDYEQRYDACQACHGSGEHTAPQPRPDAMVAERIAA